MKKVFFIFIYLLLPNSIIGQRSYQIDINNGLITNNLTDLYIDKQDNLWIASYNGLMKHEGGRIKKYNKVGRGEYNISSIEMHSVIEDKCGYIWMATTRGVDKLNPITNKIDHIYLSSPDDGSSFIGYIYWICQDEEENIWISTDIGVYKIEYNTYRIEKIPYSKDRNGMPYQAVSYTGGVSTNDGLWMSTNGGIDFYEYKTKTFHHSFYNPYHKTIFDFPKKGTSMKSDLRMDSKNKLWFVHEGKYLTCYDIKLDKIDTFKVDFGKEAWKCCWSLAIDIYDNVWIGTRHGGIFMFDHKAKKFTNIKYTGISSLIKSNYIHSVEADKYGYVYASSSNGLSIIDYYNTEVRERMLSEEPRFLSIKYESGDISYDEENKKIMIPFYNFGFFEYDVLHDTFAVFELKEYKGATPLVLAKKSGLLVAYNNNLFAYDPLKKEMLKSKVFKSAIDSIKGTIVEYHEIGKGEYILKKNKGQILHIKEDSIYILKSIGFKSNMCLSKKGNELWYLSDDVNLNKYNLVNRLTTKYNIQKHLLGTNFSFSNPRNICDDGKNIWITGQNGMIRYNYEKDVLETYTVTEGLSHSFTFSVLTDKENAIWVSSLGGIDKYNNKLNKFINIVPIKDLTYMDAFGKSILTADGKMILHFGNKLFILDNKATTVKPRKQLSLSEISVNGKYFSFNDKTLLELAHDQNNITISFALKDFINPSGVNYYYKINGSEWVDNGNITSINFNSLNYGEYNLILKAIDSNGEVSNLVNARLYILAPFYKRPWFYSLSILLLAAIVYYLYKQKIKTIQLKNDVALQMAELKSKALRAQMNPHFLFNSLNTIQECIVSKKVDLAYDYLSIFSRFLRKVLNYSESNFITFSEEIELMEMYVKLESLRFVEKVSLTTNVDESLDLDAELIPPMLLQPFIENAIRHGLRSRVNDKSIWLNISSMADSIKIDIIDNGIGIANAEEIKKTGSFSHDYESKGIEIAKQRINGLGKQAKALVFKSAFQDSLYPGTNVEIVIPKIYHTSYKN